MLSEVGAGESLLGVKWGRRVEVTGGEQRGVVQRQESGAGEKRIEGRWMGDQIGLFALYSVVAFCFVCSGCFRICQSGCFLFCFELWSFRRLFCLVKARLVCLFLVSAFLCLMLPLAGAGELQATRS